MSIITIERRVLEKNDQIANQNRARLAKEKIFTLNITSNYLLLMIEDSLYMKTVITKNITGNFTPGERNTIVNRDDHLEIL